MPTQKQDRRKKASRTPIRVVKSTSSAKPSRRSMAKASSRKAPQRASVSKGKKTARPKTKRQVAAQQVTELLQWSDLNSADNNLIEERSDGPAFLGAISTLRFALGVLAIACIFTLYVGHVYATQDLLDEVQQARRDNLSLRLQYNRTKGLYDAATGPAVIYQRAHALGLAERVVTGPPIQITRE